MADEGIVYPVSKPKVVERDTLPPYFEGTPRSEEMSDFSKQVLLRLEEAAAVYKERNAVYKDNFRTVGKVMEALFPDGTNLAGEDDFNRWHILELMIVKLTRYTQNWDKGGHADSLADIGVYAAILSGIDSQIEEDLPIDKLPAF